MKPVGLHADGSESIESLQVKVVLLLLALKMPESTVHAELERVPLSVALRHATRTRHDISDEFVRSYTPLAFAHPRVWRALLEQYRLLFSAFEEALAKDAKELTAMLPVYRALARSTAFESDLRFFAAREGVMRATRPDPVPAIEDWCARVSSLSQDDPVLLIAHIHTMYSAFLFGGRVIRSMQRRAMGLAEDEGGAIFCFPSGPSELKEALRIALDSLDISDEDRVKLCQEKGDVFRRSDSVIEQTVTSVPEAQRTVLYAYIWNRIVRSPAALCTVVLMLGAILILLRTFFKMLIK